MMLSTLSNIRIARGRTPSIGRIFLASSFLSFLLMGSLSESLLAQSLSKKMISSIDSLFSQYTEKASPGCALAVYRGGEIVYSKGYGIADLEHNVPITPSTRFDIGSTSKQFTCACLALLEQQGKLSLDDDVRKYIPELPDYGRPITIRNMLNHTSGLRDYLGIMIMMGTDIDDVTTPQEALRVITRQQGLDFETGTTHEYCNTGYFLASIIVERVSGQSLREFAAEHLFQPLGMKSTTYVDDHTLLLPNRAIGYSMGEDEEYHRNVSYWEQNGDGGIFTTVEDLQLWDENFYRPKVGGSKLIEALLRRGTLNDGTTLDYALGLYYDSILGREAVMHGGSWGGYRAELMRIPSEHLSVVVLANAEFINPTRLAGRVARVILGDRAGESAGAEKVVSSPEASSANAVSIDPSIFESYAGEYALDAALDFTLTFRRDGDRFFSQALGQDEVEIFPSSDSTFFLKTVDASITFHRDPDGTVQSMTLHQGGDYMAHRVQKIVLTPDQLRPYVGRYYSPELDTEYTLSIEEGKLVATHDQFDPITLTFAQEDRFDGDQWYLDDVRFERSNNGKVTAMLVSTGRLKDLRFEKKL